MSRPIIEVSGDLAGGIVLSTADRWLIEDAAESVARAISSKALSNLALALDNFDNTDADSKAHLDLARTMVGVEVQDKAVILARLLPFEIVGLIKQLQDALEKSA